MPLRPALGYLLALAAVPLLAQAGRPLSAAKSPTGRWLVTADVHGTPVYISMDIEQQGEKISGTYDGQRLQGSFKGGSLHFLAQDDSGGEIADGTSGHCRNRTIRPAGTKSLR
jgi:hypothetical protein